MSVRREVALPTPALSHLSWWSASVGFKGTQSLQTSWLLTSSWHPLEDLWNAFHKLNCPSLPLLSPVLRSGKEGGETWSPACQPQLCGKSVLSELPFPQSCPQMTRKERGLAEQWALQSGHLTCHPDSQWGLLEVKRSQEALLGPISQLLKLKSGLLPRKRKRWYLEFSWSFPDGAQRILCTFP